MKIPAQIVAGDTITWRDVAFTDSSGNSVDSTAYTLQYSLRGPAAGVDVVATANGNGWQTQLTSVASAALNKGASALTWYWHAVATASGGVRVTAGDGVLLVKPNIANVGVSLPFDGTSQAEKDLAAVRGQISARIKGDATLEYTIGNRSLKKEPMANLLTIEQRCLRIVARERRAQAIKNGLGNPGRVGVRFR